MLPHLSPYQQLSPGLPSNLIQQCQRIVPGHVKSQRGVAVQAESQDVQLLAKPAIRKPPPPPEAPSSSGASGSGSSSAPAKAGLTATAPKKDARLGQQSQNGQVRKDEARRGPSSNIAENGSDSGVPAQPKQKSKRQLSNAEHWKAMKAKKKAAKQSAAEVKVEPSPDSQASVSSNGSISKMADPEPQLEEVKPPFAETASDQEPEVPALQRPVKRPDPVPAQAPRRPEPPQQAKAAPPAAKATEDEDKPQRNQQQPKQPQRSPGVSNQPAKQGPVAGQAPAQASQSRKDPVQPTPSTSIQARDEPVLAQAQLDKGSTAQKEELSTASEDTMAAEDQEAQAPAPELMARPAKRSAAPRLLRSSSLEQQRQRRGQTEEPRSRLSEPEPSAASSAWPRVREAVEARGQPETPAEQDEPATASTAAAPTSEADAPTLEGRPVQRSTSSLRSGPSYRPEISSRSGPAGSSGSYSPRPPSRQRSEDRDSSRFSRDRPMTQGSREAVRPRRDFTPRDAPQPVESFDALKTTDSIDIPEDSESGGPSPILSSRPSVRDAREKRDIHRRAIHGVLKRQPSEKRTSEFVKESTPDSEQFSSAWKRGAKAKTEPAAASQPSSTDTRGRKKRSEKKGKDRYEKIDIEKQRASRVERRQQRRQQTELDAPEQEEIFEVGSEGMSVQALADKLACNSGDVLKALFMKGIMAQVNQVLDKEMVKTVAEEYGVEVLDLEEAGLESMARKTIDIDSDEDDDLLQPRPPVVTVMGHVDHGKTSLLDYVRKAKVAAGEAGGITQAIGAYTVEVPSSGDEKNITFLDTPGHEAFSAMRARGAKVTDIAIIVVAADDGVRPQTKEAISHAQAAKVPIIVAINKIDKEGANIERAKQEMSEAGLLPEEWGGSTQMVPISAKKGTGIDELLETVLLVAEVEQLVANPLRMARGTVVEAAMDRRKGPAATIIVSTGTLKVGDIVHAGATFGKVRSLIASNGKNVQEAGPSVAVQMLGLSSVPSAGDEFGVVDSEQTARRLAEQAGDQNRLKKLDEQAGGSMVTSATFATQADETGSGLQFLNIILKGDTSGSVEAVKSALLQLPQDRVALRFLLATTGDLSVGDVQLASASQANIIGFNLEPSDAVQAQVKRTGVALKAYRIIYELIDDIRGLMEGRLDSVEDRTLIGEAEVRAVFGSGTKKVAGCMVTDGRLRKGSLAVVMRGKRQVFEGQLNSLRRVKENVNEVQYGNECGVGVTDFIDWRQGDRVEAYDVQVKRQTLEEASGREVFGSYMASVDDLDYD